MMELFYLFDFESDILIFSAVPVQHASDQAKAIFYMINNFEKNKKKY